MSKIDNERNALLKGAEIEKPSKCRFCKGMKIRYWDETDEEVIFRCADCGKFIPIPFSKTILRFYFDS